MDDIFDEDGDELTLISKEYEKLSEDIGKDGLRDGISEGRSIGLQKGFDSGYADIFPAIESIYYLKGVMQAIHYSPGELSCDSNSVDDEGNKCLGELLQDLRTIEKDVLCQLRQQQSLQQATVNSFNDVKSKFLSLLERMELSLDDDSLINCSLTIKTSKDVKNGTLD